MKMHLPLVAVAFGILAFGISSCSLLSPEESSSYSAIPSTTTYHNAFNYGYAPLPTSNRYLGTSSGSELYRYYPR
ncbi:MAG: hypothetical protein ACI8UO_004481 [Verrucomicrobiales bacterium]|jgi:hypothetical protein